MKAHERRLMMQHQEHVRSVVWRWWRVDTTSLGRAGVRNGVLFVTEKARRDETNEIV